MIFPLILWRLAKNFSIELTLNYIMKHAHFSGGEKKMKFALIFSEFILLPFIFVTNNIPSVATLPQMNE